MLSRPDPILARERTTTEAAAAESPASGKPVSDLEPQEEIREEISMTTPISELRGAAIPAALAAAEKKLPAALLAVKAAQAQLDYALADGQDSREYRARLEKALREKREIHNAINELRSLIARRQDEKVVAAAVAINEYAAERTANLLARYEFSF